MQNQLYHQNNSMRRGFTIIEFMVSVTVIGILFSLILPAVQQARTTSRKLQCSNNLHQIGVAMHNFHDVKKVFPGHDFARQLLPYLDQNALMEQIAGKTFVYGTLEEVASAEEFLFASTPVFACPSDPAQSIARGRAVSYFLNIGSGFGNQNDGFRKPHKAISARYVTDGLSQTVAFSEKLISRGRNRNPLGPFKPTPDQKKRILATAEGFYNPDEIDIFADACSDSPTWFGGGISHICTWLSGGCSGFSYNHVMTPNQNSCYNGVYDGFTERYRTHAALTANSSHYGGVNVLLGDGSVRFVSDNIDRSIWRALGTRAGHEANAMKF